MDVPWTLLSFFLSLPPNRLVFVEEHEVVNKREMINRKKTILIILLFQPPKLQKLSGNPVLISVFNEQYQGSE
jgi:hypothetical protein